MVCCCYTKSFSISYFSVVNFQVAQISGKLFVKDFVTVFTRLGSDKNISIPFLDSELAVYAKETIFNNSEDFTDRLFSDGKFYTEGFSCHFIIRPLSNGYTLCLADADSSFGSRHHYQAFEYDAVSFIKFYNKKYNLNINYRKLVHSTE